jgi:sporulation protein YlmC with PRC-barrel domain
VKTIHELLGMPLVTVAEGVRLGTLRGLDFDAADGQIRGLFFAGAAGRADGVLPWSAVVGVGADAITVESVSSIVAPDAGPDRAAPPSDVRERPVVTVSGTRVGKVTGYDVDETTGRVERYHVATGGFLGKLTHQEVSFPHSAIRTYGPDAIIVPDDVVPSSPPKP